MNDPIKGPYPGQPPARAADSAEATIIDSSLDDQRRRWESGERVRVEEYLAQQPTLAGDKEAVELVERLGEPIRFGTDDPLPLLYESGFRHVRTSSFDEMCLSLTGTYERDRAFRFQHIALCSVTPRLP